MQTHSRRAFIRRAAAGLALAPLLSRTAYAEPVNPHASPEARALLAYIARLGGKNILSGQHNFPGTISQFTNRVNELTGIFPAIWGQDFGFSAGGGDGINHRPAVIGEAKKQHAAGSVITLMWHAVRPVDDEPNGWKESVQNRLTPEQWSELVTPGSALHARWTAQADVVAEWLMVLRDSNIPVLWRPYHEMNGGWFWWGMKKGEQGYAALWRMMYDRYVHHHGLNNLIWVWNTNAPVKGVDPYHLYYPGHAYVDVLATDVYENQFEQRYHDDLVTLAGGKPVALGEVGDMPTPEILEAQPRWSWFMTWTNFLENKNTKEEILALYRSPRVLTRDEVKL